MFGSNLSATKLNPKRLLSRMSVQALEDRTVPAFIPAGIINYVTPSVLNVGPQGSTGGVQSVAVNPGDPNQVYIGAVNGGIWRTDNFGAAAPTWRAIGDKLPSLSIASVSASPLNFDHIFIGTAGTTFGQNPLADRGRLSAGGGQGGTPQGVYRSMDGGVTWGQYGQAVFGDRVVREIVASGNSTSGDINGQLILAATNQGAFRSLDGGLTWAATPTAPGGSASKNVTDLKLDPSDPSGRSFYAAVVNPLRSAAAGGSNGIYFTSDAGTTWTAVNGAGDPTSTADDATAAFGDFNRQQINSNMLSSAVNIRLAIYYENRGGSITRIYATIIDGTGNITLPDANRQLTHTGFLVGIPYRSPGPQVAWADLGDPGVTNGGQGDIHIGLVAPFDASVSPGGSAGTVYVSGDRSGFRGNIAVSVNSAPSNLTGASNGTQQHADTRGLYSDLIGGIIAVGDGGIYLLQNPKLGSRTWVSKIGNLQTTEYYAAAWDSNSHVLAGAAQDNGSPTSSPIDVANGGTPPTSTFDATGGDGSIAGVDVTSMPGFSIRYSGSQNLGGFSRNVYNAAGTLISSTAIAQNLLTENQFITPFKINSVDPKRLLIGGVTRAYESTNSGFGFTQISFQTFGTPQALAYGGMRNGVANADATWVGTVARGASNPGLYFRNDASLSLGAFYKIAGYNNATMGEILDIAVDPQDYTRSYAVTRDGRAYMIKINTVSATKGGITIAEIQAATVTAITGNLAAAIAQSTVDPSNISTGVGAVTAPQPTTASIAVYDPVDIPGAPVAGDSFILIGGIGGVYVSKNTAGSVPTYTKVSTGTPNAVVQSLSYNFADDVIVAATTGRGAFILTDASSTLERAKTSISLTVTPGSTLVGDPVTFTATVTSVVSPLPSPITGNISFFSNGSLIAVVPIINGVASFTTTSLPVGTITAVATYAGNAVYRRSTSNVVTVFVGVAPTTTILTSSLNPSIQTQPVTFSANVIGSGPRGVPTGTVTFFADGVALGTAAIAANGVATFTTAGLPVGSFTITAVYNGSGVYVTSTGSLNQVVKSVLVPSITSLSTNLNPSIISQAVTFTAAISGVGNAATATGTVTFFANGVAIANGTVAVDVNGIATFITTGLPLGTSVITAVYSGSAAFLSSSASITQIVSGVPGVGGVGGVSPVGLFAVGAGVGEIPQVVVYNPDNTVRFTFQPYASGYRGGVRVAVGDVDGDGTDDIVTATGPGGAPHVTVYSGATQQLIASFFAYVPNSRGEYFSGGLFVAVGDVNGDGRKDVIVGAGPGGGPHVKAFDIRSGTELFSRFVYDQSVSTGISVATGDVNGDGRVDIIVGAGPGGGPHVKAFDVRSGRELVSYFAYDPSFTGGVVVAAGDLNGDGIADIITGTAAIGAPHVTGSDVSSGMPTLITSFFAYETNFNYGVRVAAKDRTGTGISDIITGNGPQSQSRARVYSNTGVLKADLDPFGSDLFGIFVG